MKNLTQAQAIAAYKRVCKHLGEKPRTDGSGKIVVARQGGNLDDWYSGTPLLVRDYGSWSTTTRWAVVWEEGPYDWAVLVPSDGHLERNVFVEPIESFSLGLYPYN